MPCVTATATTAATRSVKDGPVITVVILNVKRHYLKPQNLVHVNERRTAMLNGRSRATLYVSWDNTYGLQARTGNYGATHSMSIEQVIRFAAQRVKVRG